jgi:SAM-dependent methyltransferase
MNVRHWARVTLALVKSPTDVVRSPAWHCPICASRRRFLHVLGRRWAMCWACGALERHRLLWLVLSELLAHPGASAWRVLHMAPEFQISRALATMCRSYVTADLERSDVAIRCDLTALPFRDESFDLVIACHVLEHIKNDREAVNEIARVLCRGGIASVPIPIEAERTIEYPTPQERGHVRAPGLDYYEDRLGSLFTEIRIFTSSDYPWEYQLWAYSPIRANAYRPALPGKRHAETAVLARKPT